MSVVQPLAPSAACASATRPFERIREAIPVGQLRPGAVIEDAELARRLGLSVAPVSSTVLDAHLGGQPALSGYSALFS